MSNVPVIGRRFRVHARHVDRHSAREVTEKTFEAAAVAYAENYAHASEDAEINVIVQDMESGHEHCFRIDLETGETTGCG